MRSLGLVEATEDQNVLGVDGHTHGKIASGPGTLGVKVDHAPHVVVDIVHLDGVCDFLFVELCTTRKDVNILIAKNT